MGSQDLKIDSKDFNKAVRLTNVSEGGEIFLVKSKDGKYNVKVALVHGGSLFGPVIIKVKKNFDAQAEVSNVVSLLKPNTKQGISVAVDAPDGIKPNGRLRILWMEVPAKDMSSCDGKGSRDLLMVWKKLEQDGNGVAMRDIKLKISNVVNQKSVATKIPLVTLKHPGSSKGKSVVAQEAAVTERNTSEFQAENTPNESLEQLRHMKETEINISKNDNLENAESKFEALQTSSQLDTVADVSFNILPNDLSMVSVPEEIHIHVKDSDNVPKKCPEILKSHEFDPSEDCKINLESVTTVPDLHKDSAGHFPPAENAPDSEEIIADTLQEDFYDSVLSLCPIIAVDTSLAPVNDDLALEETRKRIQEVRELIQNMGMIESGTEGNCKDLCTGPSEDDLGILKIEPTAEKLGHSEKQTEAGSLQDAINSLMEDEKPNSPPGDLQDEPSVASDCHENFVSSRTAVDLWDTNTLIQRLSDHLIDPLDFLDQLSSSQEASKESQVLDEKSSIERSQSQRIENLRKNIMFKDRVIEELKAKVETLQEEIQERNTLEVAVWNEDASSRTTLDASVQIDSPFESTSYDVDLAIVKPTDTQNSSESMESTSTLPLDLYGSSYPLEPPKCQIMGCRERRPFVSTTSWNELRTSFEVDWLRGKTVHPFIHMRMTAADEEMYRIEICIPVAANNSADVTFGSFFLQVKFLDLEGHPIASYHFFFEPKNGTCRNDPVELLTHSCPAITYTSPACVNFEKLTAQVCPNLRQSVERRMLVLDTEFRIEMWMISTKSPLEDDRNLYPTFEGRIKSLMLWSRSSSPPVMRKLVFRVGTQPAVDFAIGEHILADCSPVFKAILDEQMINGRGDMAWIRLPQVLPRTVFAFSDFLHGRCTHEQWQRNFHLNLHMLQFSMLCLIRELVTKCLWNLLDMHHGDFILEEVIMLIEEGKNSGFKCLVDRGLQWLQLESQIKSVGSSVVITSIPDEEKEQISTSSEYLPPTSVPSTDSLKTIMCSKDDHNPENGSISDAVIRSTSDMNSPSGSLEENSTGKQDSPPRRNRACCVCGADSDGYLYCGAHWEQQKAKVKRSRVCFKCEKVGHKYFECNVKKAF